MKKEWSLTAEQFDSFLLWLDKDREESARKYERIRVRLISIFSHRNFPDAENLADETIDRVVAKGSAFFETYEGNPASYFNRVAQNIILEENKKKKTILLEDVFPEQAVSQAEPNPEIDCLENCLDKLPPEKKELILEYYRGKKSLKIKNRARLAEVKAISMNSLRMSVKNIRDKLRKCIENCLEKN